MPDDPPEPKPESRGSAPRVRSQGSMGVSGLDGGVRAREGCALVRLRYGHPRAVSQNAGGTQGIWVSSSVGRRVPPCLSPRHRLSGLSRRFVRVFVGSPWVFVRYGAVAPSCL